MWMYDVEMLPRSTKYTPIVCVQYGEQDAPTYILYYEAEYSTILPNQSRILRQRLSRSIRPSDQECHKPVWMYGCIVHTFAQVIWRQGGRRRDESKTSRERPKIRHQNQSSHFIHISKSFSQPFESIKPGRNSCHWDAPNTSSTPETKGSSAIGRKGVFWLFAGK